MSKEFKAWKNDVRRVAFYTILLRKHLCLQDKTFLCTLIYNNFHFIPAVALHTEQDDSLVTSPRPPSRLVQQQGRQPLSVWPHDGFRGPLTQGWAQAQGKQQRGGRDRRSSPTPGQICWSRVEVGREGVPPGGTWRRQVWMLCRNRRTGSPPWRWRSDSVLTVVVVCRWEGLHWHLKWCN